VITVPPTAGDESSGGQRSSPDTPGSRYPIRALLIALTVVVAIIVIVAVVQATAGASATGGCGGG